MDERPRLPAWEMAVVFMLAALFGIDAELEPLGLYALGMLFVAFVPVAVWLHARAIERWQDELGEDPE